jgi:tetrahydromethanopterin S-methyltransferase subunit A
MADDKVKRSLAVIEEQIGEAVAARKCHTCGCLHSTVAALANTDPGQLQLAEILEAARTVFSPKRYDCLGCAVCYPAIAANAFADAFPETASSLDPCPTEAPEERAGWPPLAGDYKVLRYRAPVAVCALNSAALVPALVEIAPEGLSIVGTMHTENLGIERVIRNVLANPNIRFLVLCGEDTQQAIGHLPGQSFASLARAGINERGSIRGANGKRPVIKNVTAEQVDVFRRQVETVDLVGDTSIDRLLACVSDLAARDPGPFVEVIEDNGLEPIMTAEPKRLIPDPAGFFVVYPEQARRRLVVEHYTNAGVLDCVLEGGSPSALYGEIVERKLISRLDHASYLGRELARAEMSLATGEPYIQDRAAGVVQPADDNGEPSSMTASCGCPRSPCGGS